MHPYLTRLGVRLEVQEFFSPFLYSDEFGDLYFPYSVGAEHYGLGFHRLPLSCGCWLAGNLELMQVSQVIVCASAMEAVAWLALHAHEFADWHSLLFFSAGGAVHPEHIHWLRENCRDKRVFFACGNDLLGRLSVLKLAAGLCGFTLQVRCLAEEKVQIRFRGQDYLFSPENLSIHALEKVSGFRFRVVTSAAKNYNSFFEQLKAAAGLSF